MTPFLTRPMMTRRAWSGVSTLERLPRLTAGDGGGTRSLRDHGNSAWWRAPTSWPRGADPSSSPPGPGQGASNAATAAVAAASPRPSSLWDRLFSVSRDVGASSSPRGAKAIATAPSAPTPTSSSPRPPIHSGYILAEHFAPSSHPIVLCHGLFGYDSISITKRLQIQYWPGIAEALRDLGCEVYIARVGSVASLHDRALDLRTFLERTVGSRPVNLVAHSMGGLDARYAITHLPRGNLDIRSLTTIATPHRGSSFMDWCRETFGVGYLHDYAMRQQADVVSALVRGASLGNARSSSGMRREPCPLIEWAPSRPGEEEGRRRTTVTGEEAASEGRPDPTSPSSPSSRSKLRPLFAPLDAPAFSNLTRDYCRTFNAITPDAPDVHYASYAAVTDNPRMPTLAFAHRIVQREEGRNDGFVSLQSARWGQFEGSVDCDHWELIPPKLRRVLPAIVVGDSSPALARSHATSSTENGAGAGSFDAVEFYLRVVTRLHDKGF